MTSTNPILYGPPSHTPDRFILDLQVPGHDDGRLVIRAFAPTSQGSIWSLVLPLDAHCLDEHRHLIIGQTLSVLMADMIRDRPSTEARAQFVASGGLYEQLSLYDAF